MSTPYLTVITAETPEGVSAQITGTIQDAAGDALPVSQITTLTLTLYEQRTGTILNGRDGADILNTGGGVVTSAGVLTLSLSPADMALASQVAASETHVALFEWTYNSGADTGRALVEFPVRNLRTIT